MDDGEKKSIRSEFKDAVNMAPKKLEDWLETDESQSVGQKDDDGEAVGHKMGHRIVEIKRKKQADLSDDDYQAMNKVVGYVHRHLKQGGPKDKEKVEGSRWRYSLMNWGHDPMKD
ncbi:DUF3140 domain-containing protein [Acuticoccus sp.]|uniref:DUF3140 domain-containing protein n=1 Tax=Acuticoccus sp. TaxID=1904378 RepID=UPI003B52E8C2